MSPEHTDRRTVGRRAYLTSAGVIGAIALATRSARAVDDLTADRRPPRDRTEITECTTITEPGHYALGDDLAVDRGENCIDVRASNVLLDGQGKTVSGTGEEGTGVVVRPAENGRVSTVAIENIALRNLDTGIVFDGAIDCRLEDATVDVGGRGTGVRVVDSENARISRTTVRADGFGDGIRLERSHRNLLTENTLTGLVTGIDLTEATENGVYGNTVTTVGTNIGLHGAHRNRLVQNTVPGATYGVFLSESNDNHLVRNSANDCDTAGIRLAESNGNRLAENATNGALAWGISLARSHRNRLLENAAVDNGSDGFRLDGSDGNRLSRNVANDNGLGQGFGFHLIDANRTTGNGNEADGNLDGPVEIDGGDGNAIEVDGVRYDEGTTQAE